MASAMRARTLAETIWGWRSALETVAGETSARRATSLMRERDGAARRGDGSWPVMGRPRRGGASIDLWLGRAGAGFEDVEVAALVRLRHVVLEDGAVAPGEMRRRGGPCGAPARQLGVV